MCSPGELQGDAAGLRYLWMIGRMRQQNAGTFPVQANFMQLS